MLWVWQINDRMSVLPQLVEVDFAWATPQGFKSIINLRPDREVGSLPDSRASCGFGV